MPRVCTVCHHPERAAIDELLVTESASNRRIAARFGVSEQAIRRHSSGHLAASLVQAAEVDDSRRAIDIYQQLREANDAVRTVLLQAQADGAADLVLKASDRILRQLELQAKLLDELNDAPTLNVVISPQWLELRAVLLDCLLPYPEAARAVASGLARLETGVLDAN